MKRTLNLFLFLAVCVLISGPNAMADNCRLVYTETGEEVTDLEDAMSYEFSAGGELDAYLPADANANRMVLEGCGEFDARRSILLLKVFSINAEKTYKVCESIAADQRSELGVACQLFKSIHREL